MNITRNVIIDLLPLYLAGEASEDTRQLVEAYLATDSSLTKLAQQARHAQPIEDVPYTLNKEHELKTLEKAKRYTQQRNLFMSMAFLFTGLLFTFYVKGGELFWFWSGVSAAIPVFVLAFLSWIMFIHSVRKLSIGNTQEMNVQKKAFLGLAVICSLIFVLLFAFATMEPMSFGILYFLFFFALAGWIGYVHTTRHLSK